jgi:signal transduction histidine kinase
VPDRDDEIARLATTMNRMLDRLDESADRQRRFVADAAHELRTPLTRIRTDVEVDLAQPDNADPTATNNAIRQETIDLQHLIDDLLHLARSDSGHRARHDRALDLDDIVLAEIRQQRTTANVSIDAGRVSAAHLSGDPGQLTRAVRNVLSNATRHAHRSVTVTLTELDHTIELTVADDGPGVPPHHQERIFERFAWVDDARTRLDGGTGLGLAITRDIIEAHGGSIAYDPEWAAGARFVVTLPVRSGGAAGGSSIR